MKKIFAIIALGTLFIGCTKDDSTSIYPSQNPNFSHITITSPTDELSVDFGETLTFTPSISQTIASKELAYEWTANEILDGGYGEQFVCGNSETLSYQFPSMSNYRLRLEVKNEDGSEFKEWKVACRAYDEGYFVVGQNGDVAFGRDLSATDILEGKSLTFLSDIIAKINPGYDFSNILLVCKSIISYGKTAANLHIFTDKHIYVADPITFEIFMDLNFQDVFPGEKIVGVSCMDTYLTAGYLFTDAHRMVCYDKAEFLIYPSDSRSNLYTTTAYMNLFSKANVNLNISEVWVDEEKSKVWTQISYYGTGPVSNTTGVESFVEDERENEYEGFDILAVTKMNGNTYKGHNIDYFTIAQDKKDEKHMKIIEWTGAYGKGIYSIDTNEYTGEAAPTFKKGAPLMPNGLYGVMYYGDGSKIYQWYPINAAPENQLPTKAAIDLGAGKKVTCFGLSVDYKQLYVGFYDENSSAALKGGMYIYDCSQIGVKSDIQPIEKYENISSKPVQVSHKSLKWDNPTPV